MASDVLKAAPLSAGPEQADRLHRFAHDIRNRLAAMQQATRLLAAPTPDLEPEELLSFAEQQFFKALRQVEHLLDDLAVDRGPGVLTSAPVDLNELLNKVLQDQAYRLERKEQKVTSTIPQPTRVMAHADTLQQVLSILLSNASKFSASGATIHVHLEQEEKQLRIHVRDHGVGLDAADLEQLFTRYAWLSSRSTAGEEQGRSMLAKARQWAVAMGGELSASSEGPGTGSTFTLVLPEA